MKTWLRKITPKPTRGALSAALQCERVSGGHVHVHVSGAGADVDNNNIT